MRIKSSGIFSSLVLLLPCLLIITAIAGCSAPKTAGREGTYRSPNYVRKNYQQLVVYAKVEQVAYRQKIENTIVDYLEKKGYHAVAAYKHFDVSYKYDSVKFMSTINELKADGVVALDYLGKTTGVVDSYRYNGGMYSFYMSGSQPFDLETASKDVGYFRIDFYNLDARVSQYNTLMPCKVFNGFDAALQLLAEDTYNRLKGDRII